jgi:uncharacterized phage protein gp47/JayE
MATENIVSSIDYTSKDFFSLREDLITRVQNRVAANGKVWSANDPSDFGVALVEAFAHIGDVTNYYIDRMANESYLSTATQRQSLLNLAAMYGYQVVGYRQATVPVTLTSSSSSVITVPAGTVFTVSIVTTNNGSSATLQEYFTLTDDVTLDVAPLANSALGTLVHGQNVSSLPENASDITDVYDIAGELLGYSSGYPSQIFTLKNNHVADGTVQVYVRNGDQYVQWTQVDNLTEYGSQDTVYSLTTDANNYVHVTFGDGISGAIPVYSDTIKATYYIGGGLEGNIEGGNTFNVYSVPAGQGVTKSDLIAALTVTNDSNSPGFGGDDPESNDDIRRNAPTAFRAANRAVSLNDFRYLALTVSGVGKAQAYATSPSAVTLYVGPTVSDYSSDYFPGMNSANTATTTVWQSLQSSVSSYLGGRTQIGTTVTILPPVYVPVHTVVEYVKDPQYTDSQVITQINSGIVYGYGYNYLDFNQNIRPEKLEQSLGQLDGIETVKVLQLYRDGSSAARTSLVAGQGEYFVFEDVNTTIYPVASLANLITTIGNGTMPPFTPLTKTYAFTSTSTTFTATATAANTLAGSAAVLTYAFTDGSGTTTTGSLTSGTASGSFTLATGVNTLAISVTSADTLNTNTYSIKITK